MTMLRRGQRAPFPPSHRRVQRVRTVGTSLPACNRAWHSQHMSRYLAPLQRLISEGAPFCQSPLLSPSIVPPSALNQCVRLIVLAHEGILDLITSLEALAREAAVSSTESIRIADALPAMLDLTFVLLRCDDMALGSRTSGFSVPFFSSSYSFWSMCISFHLFSIDAFVVYS